MFRGDFSGAGNFWNHTWYARGEITCATGQGRRLRVVLTWDSKVACTSYSACTDSLPMDLDLYVYRMPGNVLVGQSVTTANSYEVVDIPILDQNHSCVPPGTAWSYRIQAKLKNFATVPATESTFMGLAWHIYN
jgi:hypothetical protein